LTEDGNVEITDRDLREGSATVAPSEGHSTWGGYRYTDSHLERDYR
jgi:hypothetical protein